MTSPLRSIFPLLLTTICISPLSGTAQMQVLPEEKPMSAIVGSTHVGGKYFFSSRPYLKEGADRIIDMGSRTIKLWLNNSPGSNYYYNSNWGQYLLNVRNVTDLIRTPYYREALDLPFSTVVLMTTEFSVPNWKNGMNETHKRLVREELQQLTEYLLTEYKGSGKTFIISNWESDNNIRLSDAPQNLWDQYIQGMVDWTNARMDGIIAGRNNVGMDGVAVFGAFEVNHIPVGRTFDWPVTVDVVVPETYCDIYSYSNWGTKIPGEEWQIIDNLDYIASKAPPSPYFGRHNVYLGEWGAYEVSYMTPQFPNQAGDTRVHDAVSDRRQREVVMRNLDLALRWGVPAALYWQIYGNGLRQGVSVPLGQTAVEQQLRGVWLIRPPSPLLGLPYSYTSTWGSLSALMTNNRLFDPLLTTQGIHSHSSDIQLLTDEPQWSMRDNSRLAPNGSGQGSFVIYKTEASIEDFHLKLFHTPPSGELLGWWPLDEWEGTQAEDYSGSARGGLRPYSREGSQQTAPVHFDNPFAAELNGTDHIRMPLGPALNEDEWTLTGWFRLADDISGSSYRTIAASENSPGDRRFSISVNTTNGRLSVRYGNDSTGVNVPTPDTDVRDGQWHRFALAVNSTQIIFHLDETSAPSINTPPLSSTADNMHLGASVNSGSLHSHWIGQLDDFRFYRRALQADEWISLLSQPPAVIEDQIHIEISQNGSQWTPVPFRAVHTRTTGDTSSTRSYIQSVAKFHDQFNYLRISWPNAAAQMTQLGDVAIFTSTQRIQETPMTSFAAIDSYSDNWQLDLTSPISGLPGARSSTNSSAYIVHRANSITAASHNFRVRNGENIQPAYAFSYDGKQWNSLAAKLENEISTGNGWTEQTWSPTYIPAGTRYLRLTIQGGKSGLWVLNSFSLRNSPMPFSIDSDMDGWTDLEESWLGTDPTDAASRLEFDAIHADNQGVHLQFKSIPDVRYRIERTADIQSGIWQLFTELTAQDILTQISDQQGAQESPYFYRIRLAL